MLKKIAFVILIAAIGTVLYTEKTGKTNFGDMVASYILGEDVNTDDEPTYTLIKSEDETAPLSAGEQAIKDAGEYHNEANSFANKTNDTVNDVNEKIK